MGINYSLIRRARGYFRPTAHSGVSEPTRRQSNFRVRGHEIYLPNGIRHVHASRDMNHRCVARRRNLRIQCPFGDLVQLTGSAAGGDLLRAYWYVDHARGVSETFSVGIRAAMVVRWNVDVRGNGGKEPRHQPDATHDKPVCTNCAIRKRWRSFRVPGEMSIENLFVTVSAAYTTLDSRDRRRGVSNDSMIRCLLSPI